MPKVVDHATQCSQIALAACQAIARKGVDRTTMIDIAREAGVTTGMITHYYQNKADIITAALRLVFQRTEQRLKARTGDCADPLFEILKETLPIDQQRLAECSVWVSFWGSVSVDTALVRANRELHEDAEELYARVTRSAWPESDAWRPQVFEQAWRSILIFLNGLTASAVTSPHSWSAEIQLDALHRHLVQVRTWANAQ